MQQQLFKGVDEAVMFRLAQCRQSEDVLRGQIIHPSDQKVQDLLILRQGHAFQQGQPSEQGEQALCSHLILMRLLRAPICSVPGPDGHTQSVSTGLPTALSFCRTWCSAGIARPPAGESS